MLFSTKEAQVYVYQKYTWRPSLASTEMSKTASQV